jgi:glycogen synthase
MTILFICNEYPPGKSGGIGSMTRVLARAMVKAGHQVLVAGLYAHGYGQKDYEEDQGVKVWRRR